MSQGELTLLSPLVWEDAAFWGKTTACRRFSIRTQTINGKTEHVLWAMGKDGKVIPKWLGVFETFDDAVKAAEERKYGEIPKNRTLIGWKREA